MVAHKRIPVRETMGRENNCKLNFFSKYFIRNNQKEQCSFENGEKQRTQALKIFFSKFKHFPQRQFRKNQLFPTSKHTDVSPLPGKCVKNNSQFCLKDQ